MRPLGAAFLGAYVDTIGRRQGLLLTLGIMAMGTILIAFVPSYQTIGMFAPFLVLLGRLLQGFSAGVELGGVSVYLAVRQGAPTPDISSVEGLRQAMLAARTIAISDSASGVYIQREMLRKLGIEDQVRSKIRVVQADPVGETVARGDADLGFQQISELKPVHGIVLLGPIPDAVQEATLYKAGVVATSRIKDADRELERFLTSPAAAAVLEQSGLEPTATRH